MHRDKRTAYLIFPAYLALAAIAYWQVAFLQNGLKWDMLGCYLPWRYHVGECLQNGIFPLWNPFTHGGYPIHADLRSVWYPETFIVGLTSGYSYLTLHLLFILHVSLSGFGMYRLSQHFTGKQSVAFIAGAAYLMSGFIVGHGQEMFGIIAATWIPFVLYYFIRLQKERAFPDVLRTAVFLFLLVTGGYQAMWAILFYLMLALFVTFLIRYLRSGMNKEAWQLVGLNALLMLFTALSLAVIAVTFLQVSPHVGRLGGVSIADAWFMPFSPRSAVSFLLPFATVKDVGWYDTDISMNNAYSGLIVLIFFFSAVFSRKGFLLNVFLIFGLTALLASFGKYTPVRGWLYHFVPMFDLFRHSGFFVYFTVIAIIPGAASALETYLSDPHLFRKKLYIITALAALVIIALLSGSLAAMENRDFLFFRPAAGFASWLEKPGRHEHTVIQAVIQLVVLLVFVILIAGRRKLMPVYLTALVCFEMFLAVQMNSYYTIVSAGVKPFDIQHILKQRPEGFPLPVPGIPVSVNTEQNAASSVIWQNTNIFNKAVSFEGYNSFRLNGYETLADSFPALAQSVIQNEVVYLSDQVRLYDRDSLITGNITRNVLFTDNARMVVECSGPGLTEGDSVRITGFHPGWASAEVSCRNKVAVTLLQGWYPGWEASIDGEASPLFVSNKMFISTICPPGKHLVSFTYRNRPVVAGFIISYLVVLIMISVLIYIRFRDKGWFAGIAGIAGMWLLVFVLAFAGFYPAWSAEAGMKRAYRIAAAEIVRSEAAEVICNTGHGAEMAGALKEAGFTGKFYLHNLTYQKGLSDLLGCIDTLRSGKVALISLYAGLPDAAVASMQYKWPQLSHNSRLRGGSLMLFSEGGDIERITSLYDFEKALHGWNGNPAALDSAHSASGRFSNRVDSLNHGSYSFRWKPETGQRGKPFKVYVRARVAGDFSGGSLFIELMRNGSPYRSSAVSSRTWQVTPGRWSDVAGVGYFDDGAAEEDEIRVYFWGSGHSAFYVDDFLVTVDFSGR